MNAEAERRFREFVAGQLQPLLRTAYLLSGNWHAAEDLVQTTFVQLYRAWPRATTWDDPRAYARQSLTNAFLSATRRRWWSELPVAEPPEPAAGRGTARDEAADVAERDRQLRLLRGLPPRQRAVLVLRFWEDYSVAETARLLGVAGGTVKRQTADALATLRRTLAAELATELRKEPSHD